MIGRRLKRARTASGLSLRELESAIDNRVTAQAISKYERDEAMPSSNVLIALANALGVAVAYLVEAQETTLESVEFRRQTFANRREQAQAEANILAMLERYLAVEDLLGLPIEEWDRPRGAPFPVAAGELEAELAAYALRTHWSLGAQPVFNVVQVLEGRGVKVLPAVLGGTDGVAADVRRRDGHPIPVLVVATGVCAERQRFALARELGHMVLSTGRKVNAERAANRFAGAFLMPAETVWSEVGRRRRSIGLGELFDLKLLFGVSAQALARRCRDLAIFGPTLYKRLLRELGLRGWSKPPFVEPLSGAQDDERPRRFERLCLRALAEGVVSEPKAAELLNTSVAELNRRMEEAPQFLR